MAMALNVFVFPIMKKKKKIIKFFEVEKKSGNCLHDATTI